MCFPPVISYKMGTSLADDYFFLFFFPFLGLMISKLFESFYFFLMATQVREIGAQHEAIVEKTVFYELFESLWYVLFERDWLLWEICFCLGLYLVAYLIS